MLIYFDRYLRDSTGSMMIPFPSSAVLYSPWMDLSFSTNSVVDNAQYDYLPVTLKDVSNPVLPGVHHPVFMYIFGHNPKRALPEIEHWEEEEKNDVESQPEPKLKRQRSDSGVDTSSSVYDPILELMKDYTHHPLISPMFHDSFEGFPPILIQSGDSEMFKDESIIFAKRVTKTNGKENIRLELYKDMFHDFVVALFLEASQTAFNNAKVFMTSLQDGIPVEKLPKPTEDDLYILDAHLLNLV
jgi:acetyl esterase/lipase